jgi:adenylate kinase family enzyme
MNKNIIMGIGRAGKTTLSNMIKDKYNDYNIIHSDSLKWAMIRAANKESEYKEKVDKQKEFEHGEYFQKTLLELYKSLIRNDTNHYGYILESGQLHPKIVSEMIDFNTTNIICLGLGNLSLEDMVEQCIKYDTEKSWTYQLPKEYLRKHAKDWYDSNEMLKKECPNYGIKYIDTSKNRQETLQKIVDSIIQA